MPKPTKAKHGFLPKALLLMGLMMVGVEAWGANCLPYGPNLRSRVADPNTFTPFFNRGVGNDTIYFCQVDRARSFSAILTENEIVTGGSQSKSMGSISYSVPLSTSQIDLSGFTVNDGLRTSVIFRRLGNIPKGGRPFTGYLGEPFRFAYFRPGVDEVTRDEEYCETAGIWDRLEQELLKRATSFKVKVDGKAEVSASPYVRDHSDFDHHKIDRVPGYTVPLASAKITDIDDEKTKILVSFVARKDGVSGKYTTDTNGNVYCLWAVGVQAEIDLNTARAGKRYSLNIRLVGD